MASVTAAAGRASGGETVEQVRPDHGRRRARLVRVGATLACTIALAGCTASGGEGSASSGDGGSSDAPAPDGLPPDRADRPASRPDPNGLPPERTVPNEIPATPSDDEDGDAEPGPDGDDPTASCLDLARQDWAVGKTDSDIVDLAEHGKLPRVRPDLAPRVTNASRWRTTEALADVSNLEGLEGGSAAKRAERLRLLQSLGYHDGIEADYLRVPDEHWAMAFRFRDAEAAHAYAIVMLGGVCQEAQDVRELHSPDGLLSGIEMMNGNGGVRAVFIVGDAVVNLGMCDCLANQSYDLMDQWQAAVVDALHR
jgi:hypothetical protein